LKIRIFLSGLLSLVLSACASHSVAPRPDLTVVQSHDLPPPDTTDLILPQRAFVIGPLDQVSVEVYGLPELSRSVQVDSSGQISLPLVGSIQVAGKTPAQVGQIYADGLKGRYVRDPQVTVNLTDTVSQNMSVGGAVGSPGIYPVIGRMTLLRALARAEGINEFGKENEVVVYRRVNNKDMAALYHVRAIRAGAYADPEIYANDVIEVSESRGRRIFRDVITASPLLSVPLLRILQ